MSARADILARLRGAVAGPDRVTRQAAAEARLLAAARGPQPVLPPDGRLRFQQRAVAQACTVDAVAGWASVPAAVASYLETHDLGTVAVATPDLAAIDWASAGLRVACRGAVDADQVGISGCFCAIAETGTLLLLSGPQTPATVSLLPETHVTLVDSRRIVATMEDAFALLRAEHGQLPRAVNFVSGPSRTGDIEQTIVLGAHGPCRVHLILIGETV